MAKQQFYGKWHIIDMDQWDNDYIDMIEPGYLEFQKNSTSGYLHFGCIYADIDYRINKNSNDTPTIEFSFIGDDEGDEISGRGTAILEEGSLEGDIYFHNSDESSFSAEPY